MNYYNDNDPNSVALLRELISRGLIADGVVDDRSILDVQPDDLRGFIPLVPDYLDALGLSFTY